MKVFGDVENHCLWKVCLVMLRIIVCESVFGDVENHCLWKVYLVMLRIIVCGKCVWLC